MTAIELLKRQHAEMAALFADFESRVKSERHGSEEELSGIVEALADALVIHIAIEERYLYPDASDVRSEEELRQALAEHLLLKHALADLLETDPEDTSYRIKLEVLKGQFEKHVTEEERSFFPVVLERFEVAQLERMAEQMEAQAEELSSGPSAREQVAGVDERLFNGALEPPRARG